MNTRQKWTVYFPVAAAMLYPFSLMIFALAMELFLASNTTLLRSVYAVGAIGSIAFTLSVPALALYGLIKARQHTGSRAINLRRLYHIIFAVPPLYTLMLLWAFTLGVGQWLTTVWLAFFVIAVLFLAAPHKKDPLSTHRSCAAGLRIVHGITALILLLGFLLPHLLNHTLALWSPTLHSEVMTELRLWYRSEWVEPVLWALLALMVLTGVPMAMHYTRTGGDHFRVLQTSSGIYLALFICSHLSAVLLARQAGVETDWLFAVGENGLLHGRGMLIPYYSLAVLLLIVHAACGLRTVLAAHHVPLTRVNRLTVGIILLGVVVTLIISLPMLGVFVQA